MKKLNEMSLLTMIKDTITFRQITPEMAKHAEIQGFNLVATLKSIIQET